MYCTAPLADVIYFCKKGQGRPGGRRRGRGGEEEEIFKRMAEFRKLFSLEDEVVGDKEQEALEIFVACAMVSKRVNLNLCQNERAKNQSQKV